MGRFWILRNDYAGIAMDTMDFTCYLSDIENYDLLYLNNTAMKLFGVKDESEYLGTKCYKFLQGKDQPCEFCTNHLLKAGENHVWEIYNEPLKKYFSLVDTLVPYKGKYVRMEIAADNTNDREVISQLTSKLTTEETLIRCVQTLSEEVSTDEALNKLLAIVGDYYASDRSYIFEFDLATRTMNNTYEWCRDISTSAIAMLKNIDLELIKPWTDCFSQFGEFFINSLERDVEKGSETYETLESQGIDSLIAAPIIDQGEIVGFIGVDNPTKSVDNPSLLRSVSLFVHDDLTKRRLRQELEDISYQDKLTGLYNRNKYIELLGEFETTPPTKLGIVFADINGLKEANDQYGHDYGDYVIIETAKALRSFLGENVFRAGGDEFIALCPNFEEKYFEEKVSALRNFVRGNTKCNVAIGSTWKQGKIDVLKEVGYTDELMYVEKQSYYKSMLTNRNDRNSIMAKELIKSIDDGSFTVFIQPKVELKTGKIIGGEALVRRFDVNGGLIPPDKFIPLYEREGAMRHLDLFVLELTCKSIATWMKSGDHIQIAVNMSRVTFMEHDIIDEIECICNKYGVPLDHIDIEITESSGKMDHQILGKRMNETKARGFSVSLDDFGAHYSNLLMLTSMEFSVIKIDKSLVDNICEDKSKRLVLEYTVNLLKSLNNTKSLAEGIEDAQQREVLNAIGCDYGQGYYFAKPMPINDFYELYKTNDGVIIK